jgi:hypothetical protein
MNMRLSIEKDKLRYWGFARELARLGIKQAELAEKLGVSRQVVHNWVTKGSIHAHKRFKWELLNMGFNLKDNAPQPGVGPEGQGVEAKADAPSAPTPDSPQAEKVD